MRTQAQKSMKAAPPPKAPSRTTAGPSWRQSLVKAHAIPETPKPKVEEIKVKRTPEQILHELPVEVRGGGLSDPFEAILTANGAKAVLAALKAKD